MSRIFKIHGLTPDLRYAVFEDKERLGAEGRYQDAKQVANNIGDSGTVEITLEDGIQYFIRSRPPGYPTRTFEAEILPGMTEVTIQFNE